MRFYLGTPETSWLATCPEPLFVAHPRLARLRKLPRRLEGAPWALDSGGFTELSKHGEWTITAAQYVKAVRRYCDQIGRPVFASPMDWMCEEQMLRRTGRTVAEHQKLTLENFLDLRMMAPDLPWAPVLQGWTNGQYRDHADAYMAAGVDLTAEPVVGLGSVCRRQNMIGPSLLITSFAHDGIRLHGFGFKTQGLLFSAPSLESADSMAWSFAARNEDAPTPGHTHRRCSNCADYALTWRDDLLHRVAREHPGITLDDWDPNAPQVGAALPARSEPRAFEAVGLW